jgi:Flp pilus assembly pilin Flp
MPFAALLRRSRTAAAAKQPDQDAPAAELPRWPRRRAATAMEYLVVASFILVVLIAGVQHLASITRQNMQKDADATNFNNPQNPGP